MRAALWALLLAITLTACGGDDGGSSPSPSPPGQDPCAASRLEAFEAQAPASSSVPAAKSRPLDPSPRWRVLESLWIHQQATERRRSISTLGPIAATSADIGDIAVLRDEGDLIVPANTFDLKGLGLRFTRNSQGGYDVGQTTAGFRTAIGNRVTLEDDDTPARGRIVLVSVLLGERADGFRQLRRQRHVSRRRQREHGPQRRPPADRPAARRTVSGRPRPERRRRRLRQLGERPVHRHVVQRPRLRVDAHDVGAGHAAARWIQSSSSTPPAST